MSGAAPGNAPSSRAAPLARRRLRVDAAYDRSFQRSSAAFEILGPEIERCSQAWGDWPEPAAYDAFGAELARHAGRALRFRDANKASVAALGGYDAFIHHTGVIPTRSRNWHDFFNACIWARLPRTKLAIHALQLREVERRRGAARTRVQDWLTHFDECGVVVVSDRAELLERIARLEWQELFLAGRGLFERHVRVWCCGHAVLEALREPYVGLMGKALLCHAPDGRLEHADHWTSSQLSSPTLPRLHALPVLGLPGWHQANEDPAFYDQPAYFRSAPLTGERSTDAG